MSEIEELYEIFNNFKRKIYGIKKIEFPSNTKFDYEKYMFIEL